MRLSASRCLAALTGAALVTLSIDPVGAQDPKGEPKPPQQGEVKDGQKKIDEYAEAARLVPGPAGRAECVWLGRRIVSLLWRDDLDTAFRHFDLYDRFGCPGAHIQVTFRCVVRQGNIDPKAPESLSTRVHACWINPNLPPVPAAQAPQAGGTKQQ